MIIKYRNRIYRDEYSDIMTLDVKSAALIDGTLELEGFRSTTIQRSIALECDFVTVTGKATVSIKPGDEVKYRDKVLRMKNNDDILILYNDIHVDLALEHIEKQS